MSLRTQIDGGETEILEFKETFRYDVKTHTSNKALKNEVSKAVCGMFNSKEGIVLIGVANDKTIWGEFGDGKVSKMENDVIAEFAKRWINMHSKTRSEQSWYDAYYKQFYRGRFMPWIKDIYNYMRDRSNVWVKSEICEWFINTYLRDEGLFYYKSLDSFVNNI